MKLAIISHTEHYRRPDGTIVGWGPTVSEVNYLAGRFETIYHIAVLHPGAPPPSSLPYTDAGIVFVPLPPSGGKSLRSKLSVIARMPTIIRIVGRTLKKADVFQLRTPTGMGVYLIPWLTLFNRKKGWYKYAGNWVQEKPPLGYALQRWFLKNQKRKVTINGSWKDQPSHCITFENPCLTGKERSEGAVLISRKKYKAPYIFCFVGRLEDEKGVQRILDAFAACKETDGIQEIHFIGNGPKGDEYRRFAKENKLPAIFHGFLSRTEVFDIYKKSHFIVLPSTASEGFPKVVAEGMNYGCIPVVSTVSGIGQYITPENGYNITPVSGEALYLVLRNILSEPEEILRKRVEAGYKTASLFTFERYSERILKEILENE